jgi:hypothetical protein
LTTGAKAPSSPVLGPRWQRPATQAAPVGHCMPQPPQCRASVRTLTSQPSMRLLLQSAKPIWQPAEPHWPSRHTGTALGGGAHARPQAPQWATSLRVSKQRSPQQV